MYRMKLALVFISTISTIFCQRSCLDHVAVLTVPKSGTHLLHKLLFLLTEEKRTPYAIAIKLASPRLENLPLKEKVIRARWSRSEYISSHFDCPEAIEELLLQRKELKSLIMLRDPRDVLVSLVNWVSEPIKNHYFGCIGMDLGTFQNADFNQKLASSITNTKRVSMQAQVSAALNFSRKPNTCVVLFENLVGLAGGGSDDLQIKEINKVVQFLGLSLSLNEIKEVGKKLFGGTNTFRKGQIGAHKNSFNHEHNVLYKNLFGSLHKELRKIYKENGTSFLK